LLLVEISEPISVMIDVEHMFENTGSCGRRPRDEAAHAFTSTGTSRRAASMQPRRTGSDRAIAGRATTGLRERMSIGLG
jgi:hypothetical protein